MGAEPNRNHTRLAMAVVLAALIVAAAIFASFYLGTQKTVTETTVSTSTTTVTSSVVYPLNTTYTTYASFTYTPTGPVRVESVEATQSSPQANDQRFVAFAVTAKPGTSGTYELEFSTGGYMLTGSEPVQCAFLGELIAGNGHPDYTLPGGCLTIAETSTSNASSPTIPGIAYPIYDNLLYFRVIGVINSQ